MMSVEPNFKAKLPILVPEKLDGKIVEGCIISNAAKDKKSRRLQLNLQNAGGNNEDSNDRS